MNIKRMKKLFQPIHPGRGHQKGQSMVEYCVVSAFGVIVLTTGVNEGVRGALERAVRNNYDGFSYAVSLSDYPDKENYLDLVSMYNEQGMADDDYGNDYREYLTDNPNDMVRELAGYALTSIPGVTEGLDMAEGIGLDPIDFCDICTGNPFDAL